MTGPLSKEIAINFERVCVMEQRQFMTMKLERQGDVPEECAAYACAVEEFNAAFDDHRTFEKYYLSDLDQRTRANAVILDEKYEVLKQKFIVLKPLIIQVKK